ncbi:MAG: TetR/AcrR family transcriptional regulator, partial [Flavobacteriaceae bacterium]|nr:TetR/AcrR family transcriptional regulator [Flavobacteriaceae bacterium]
MKQSLKSKATQNLIINKSFEMFYSNGFKSTNIPDIMRETSLSKGAFYHHFKN